MQLNDALKKRKTVIRYSTKKPNWRKIIKAIDAARYAPNAEGQFAMQWILVSDEKKIAQFSGATQQEFVSMAKYIVVAVSDDTKMIRSYGDRGPRYSSLQAGAAIQNFLLELVEQKLVTKWVKYFAPDEVKRILSIPDKAIIEGIFPIGIETKRRTEEEKRRPLETYIRFDKWGEKKMRPHSRVLSESP